MKKLLAVLPLVAGASWAGTTYYSGAQTRDAYDQFLAQINQVTAFAVENESYTAGFMKSTAITTVKTSDKSDATVMFRLSHVIDHSPIGFTDGSTRVSASNIQTTMAIDPGSDAATKINELFGDVEPVVLTSTVGFNGKTLNELRTAPLEIVDEDGVFKISESVHEFDLDPDGKLVGSGELSEFSFVSNDGFNLSTTPIKQAFDLNWVQDGVFTGSNNLVIDKVSYAVSKSGLAVDMSDVTYEQFSEMSDGKIGYDLTLAAADVQSPVNLESVKLTSSLKGINVDSVRQAQEYSNEMLANGPDSVDISAYMSEIGNIYKSMITKGASIGYGLGYTNEFGAADSNINLTFKGDDSVTGMDNMATVGDLVNALQASFTVDADAAALESTPLGMLLYNPQASQVLVEENGKYTSNITLDESVVNINGQPLSLALMIPEPLQMPLDPSLLMMLPGSR